MLLPFGQGLQHLRQDDLMHFDPGAEDENEKTVSIGTSKVLTARGRIFLTASKTYFILRNL